MQKINLLILYTPRINMFQTVLNYMKYNIVYEVENQNLNNDEYE